MPNQTDPNQITNTTSTPPVSVQHTDLPPLPDFMNVPASQTPPTTPPVDDSSGSAAPPDLPPVVATPKKKFGGGKIIATILGLVLLVGGVGAGVVLTQQQQLFNQKAGGLICVGSCKCHLNRDPKAITDGSCSGPACECSCPSDTSVDSTTCKYGPSCAEGATQPCGNCNSGKQTCTGGNWGSCAGQGCSPGATQPCGSGGTQTCSSSCAWGNCNGGASCSDTACNGVKCTNGQTCTSANGTCSCTGGTTPTCTNTNCAGVACTNGAACKTNASGSCSCVTSITPCAAPYTCENVGSDGTSMGCSGANKKPHSEMTCSGSNKICCETLASTDLCAGVGCSTTGCSIGSQPGSSTCFVSHYWCQTKSPGGCSTNLIEKGNSASFSKDCGTEQIDVYCAACGVGSGPSNGGKYVSKTYASDCSGTPPPGTPPPGAPMCTAIKAYDTSWNLLTPAQLSALKAGDKVRFTVAGSPADQIDKAQFAITAMVGEVNQGTPSGDVTVKKPGTDEYFFEYTIPDGTKSVSVTGQVHHSTLGWY